MLKVAAVAVTWRCGDIEAATARSKRKGAVVASSIALER
jgi:hypothetical protein